MSLPRQRGKWGSRSEAEDGHLWAAAAATLYHSTVSFHTTENTTVISNFQVPRLC